MLDKNEFLIFFWSIQTKGPKTKSIHPKSMFLNKLYSRKGLFLKSISNSKYCAFCIQSKIFNYIGSWIGSKPFAKLSSSFLLRMIFKPVNQGCATCFLWQSDKYKEHSIWGFLGIPFQWWPPTFLKQKFKGCICSGSIIQAFTPPFHLWAFLIQPFPLQYEQR